MPREAAPTAVQLSEQVARLREAYQAEITRKAHLQVLDATLTAAVAERSAWLNNLRSSSLSSTSVEGFDDGEEDRDDRDEIVANLLGSLQVDSKSGPEKLGKSPQPEQQPPISAAAARRGPSHTAPAYIRSLLTEEHLKVARGSVWQDITKRVSDFVSQATEPLATLEKGEPAADAVAADDELEQLETDFQTWMLPRHIVVPEEMQMAISVRLDTHETSATPPAVTAHAVSKTRLTSKQRHAIVIGYAMYLRTQPGEQSKQLLQQLSAAVAEHPFSLKDPHTRSFKTLVDDLEGMLAKWQQCAMVLSTVIWNTLTTRQVTLGAVACYPYWFSGSDCKFCSISLFGGAGHSPACFHLHFHLHGRRFTDHSICSLSSITRSQTLMVAFPAMDQHGCVELLLTQSLPSLMHARKCDCNKAAKQVLRAAGMWLMFPAMVLRWLNAWTAVAPVCMWLSLIVAVQELSIEEKVTILK